MSYIRSLSNPEGLYVFSTDHDKTKKAVVCLIPGWNYKHTNFNNNDPMYVPQAVFDQAVRRWDAFEPDDGVTLKGFSIRQVHVFTDTGKPVPKGFNPLKSKRDAEFLIRVAYRKKWMLLWRVTWAYVVHNAMSDHRKPRSKKTRPKQ